MPSEEFDFKEQDAQANKSGQITVSEDVIASIAVNTLNKLPNIKPATSGFMSDLYHGKRTSDGVRVFCDKKDKLIIRIDIFVLVKYGPRIPDVCWDVQEQVKTRVEEVTGMVTDSVNIYVQGIYFDEAKPEEGTPQK